MAAFGLAVLPADRIRLRANHLQGLVGSYAYQAPAPLPSVSGLAVKEVYLPGRLRIEWDDMGASMDPGGFHYFLHRKNPTTGPVLCLEEIWEHSWEEDIELSSTAQFEYKVTLVPNSGGVGSGELPPLGATDIECCEER